MNSTKKRQGKTGSRNQVSRGWSNENRQTNMENGSKKGRLVKKNRFENCREKTTDGVRGGDWLKGEGNVKGGRKTGAKKRLTSKGKKGPSFGRR